MSEPRYFVIDDFLFQIFLIGVKCDHGSLIRKWKRETKERREKKCQKEKKREYDSNKARVHRAGRMRTSTQLYALFSEEERKLWK